MASNSLINGDDKFVEYKYKITEFYMLLDNSQDSIPIERIRNFKIEHFFEEASFPIFKMNVLMEPSRYYNILKNKNTVRFKIRLQKFYTVNGDDKNKSLVTDVFNTTFRLFPDDDANDYDKSSSLDNKSDLNELEELTEHVELFLFKDIVTSLRSSFNTVLTNCNMCTAVTYLLHKANVKNVLMSPFENTRTYGTLLLPPQSIEKQIKFLNNNYGFHKKGTIVYFGLLHSYILNYKGGCTAWYNKEWKETTIYVLKESNSRSALTGAILKSSEERFYYNATPNVISISNDTVSSNVIQGTDATVIDMQNSSTVVSSSKSNIVGSANNRVLFNNTSNPYMAETYTAQQKANSTIIRLGLQHVNLEAFNPNKSFSMVFEDATLNAKYKGTYRIASAIYVFEPSGENYIVDAVVTLKKTD